MFGRKRRVDEDDLEDVDDDLADDEDDDESEEDIEEEDEDEDDAEEDYDDEDDVDEEPEDEWEALDASRDWREDGPFDISEVDLDADDIQRLDFGSLIVTPFDGMQLQLQVKQDTEQVQALLVVDKKSAIEVALFAAPAKALMLAEVRGDMQEATDEAGGTMTLVKGPLGTEVRRKLPVESSDGKKASQASRTWLVQGPKWLLRGVLMGQAALANDVSKGEAQLLFEFFCNLVVRRGGSPRVPGDLIPLDMPASVSAGLAEKSD